jgi:hypothetical protein
MDKLSTAVDQVLAEQFAGLIKPFGPSKLGEVKSDKKAVKDAPATADKKALEKPDTMADDEWSLNPSALEEGKPAEKVEQPAAKPGAAKPKTGKPVKVEPDNEKVER